MAYSDLDVTAGNAYSITIGAGGAKQKNGGITSFGTLLSANGGSASSGRIGGDGGTGGGAACSTADAVNKGGNGT